MRRQENEKAEEAVKVAVEKAGCKECHDLAQQTSPA